MLIEQPQLIIFDCDNTLVSSEHLNNLAVYNVFKQLGITYYKSVNEVTEKFKGYSAAGLLNILKKEHNYFIARENFIELVNEELRILDFSVKPVKNAKEIIELVESKNIKKCVASNGEKEIVIKYLQNSNLYHYFNEKHIFTYEQVRHPKPAPDLFLYACNSCAVKENDALVIEDSPVGIKAAKEAGIKAIGITHGITSSKEELLDAGADFIIEDLLEISQFI